MLDAYRHKAFARWQEKIRDNIARKLIQARIRQVQVHEEFVGDCKPVGDGVTEMRIDFGPGYRVYAAIRRRKLLLLLAGGDKSSQVKDIEKAKAYLAEWTRVYGEGNEEPKEGEE